MSHDTDHRSDESRKARIRKQGAQAEDAPRGFLRRLYRLLYRNAVEPLVKSTSPPWFDARGAAVGLVIGFGVPVGGHILIMGLLRAAFRFNLVIALAFSCVANPFNIVPLYYGYYLLGSLVVGGAASIDFEVFERLMHPVMDSAYFWEACQAFLSLGTEFLARWCVSAAILATTSGIAGYWAVHRIQTDRCRKRAEKMGLEYEKFLKALERKSFGENGPILPAKDEG